MAPTNRPFFANFFAAFRARTNPTFQAKSSPTGAISAATLTSTAHVSTTTTAVMSSNPRSISTKATTTSSDPTTSQSQSSTTRAPTSPFSAAAAAAAAASSHRYASPLSRSPGTSSPGGHTSLSPPGTSTPLTRGRQRRGSDSSNSSGGFIDALGPEKWYIGGRTATGEEKFYRIGLVTGASGRRVRSLDRLSL